MHTSYIIMLSSKQMGFDMLAHSSGTHQYLFLISCKIEMSNGSSKEWWVLGGRGTDVSMTYVGSAALCGRAWGVSFVCDSCSRGRGKEWSTHHHGHEIEE